MDNNIKIRMIVYIGVLLCLATGVYADQFLVNQSSHNFAVNEFLSNNKNMLSFLIPGMLLLIILVMFSIDFGVAGVCISSSFSLVLLYLAGIIYINTASLISFLIMIGIAVYKLNQ